MNIYLQLGKVLQCNHIGLQREHDAHDQKMELAREKMNVAKHDACGRNDVMEDNGEERTREPKIKLDQEHAG